MDCIGKINQVEKLSIKFKIFNDKINIINYI